MIPPSTGRGGGRSGGVGRGGFRIQGRINVPPALPSINRPSFPIDEPQSSRLSSQRTARFGRARRSPFDARRGTYTRLQQFPGIPYGIGYDGYGYGALPYAPESTYERCIDSLPNPR